VKKKYLLVILSILFILCCGGSQKVIEKKEEIVIPDFIPEGVDVAVIDTKFGSIYIKFFEEIAPEHCKNFKKLINDGFYDDLQFHRIIPSYLIQGGDPLSKDDNRLNDGMGGPGYTLRSEFGKNHIRGSVAAARLNDDINPEKRSNGSQFYICLNDLPQLDSSYTVFAEVISGIEVADSISVQQKDLDDNPIEAITMQAYLIHK